MIRAFLRFYFSRSTRDGVTLRRIIKDAMPQPKARAKL